jgi:hypothetical protein
MNYWDGQKWSRSNPSFEDTGEAFVAVRVQHKVRLAADLGTQGAVTVTTPDGQVLRSTPVAIALYDAASGRTAVVGVITNCTGTLISSNTVLYPNAFAGGGVCADVLYRLERGSFAQDVVFTGRLDPAAWGLPSDTTRIQIITEFYGAPEPQRRVRLVQVETNQAVRALMASPDLADEMIGFGQGVIGPGGAYRGGVQAPATNALVPVGKEFKVISGRSLLFESVAYRSVKRWLQSLPECHPQAAARGSKLDYKKAVVGYAAIPTPKASGKARGTTGRSAARTARTASAAPEGLIVDYLFNVGGSIDDPMTFSGDATWFISGPVYCNGPVTIEGGAVLKYPVIDPLNPNPGYSSAALNLYNGLICQTQPYQPAILTAADDDSNGISLCCVTDANDYPIYPEYNGGLPDGNYYGGAGLNVAWAPTTTELVNLRFLYLSTAVMSYAGGESGTGLQLSFRDLQVLKCGSAFLGTYDYTARNCLFWEDGCVFDCLPEDYAGETVRCEQVTCHNCGLFIRDFTSIVRLTNCLVVQAPGLETCYSVTAVKSPILNSDTDVFQTSGNGSHYLPVNSNYRSFGTTAIDPTLLTALHTKTTQPPLALPLFMVLTGDLTLCPQVPRYASGPPDSGYYYDALDYTVARVLLAGANLTVLPGTAIATRNECVWEYDPDYGPWCWWTFEGFGLAEGSSLISHGTPTTPSTFTSVTRVQEQPQTDFANWRVAWDYPFSTVSFLPYWPSDGHLLAPTCPPILDLRFCNLSLAPEDFHVWGGKFEYWYLQTSMDSLVNMTLRDCNISCGVIELDAPVTPCMDYGAGAVSWINNFFGRVEISLDPSTYWDYGMLDCDIQVEAYNNLFRGGYVLATRPCPATAGHWTFKDNLFDKVHFYQDTDQPLDYDHNAYWPLTASALYGTGDTAMLSPTTPNDDLNGGNEITLGAAPAYGAGPLGNYYLPSSSQICNAGSRSPAEAGLYHYTTRADQTKDADQTAVNIGLHYIATAGPGSSQPKDTDGDGIPDYVENWHGDGVYHPGSETKWQQDYTTTGVEDKNNAIYDDIDLDGDGMVGRIETALSKNPLVADNPLTLLPATSPGPNRMAFVVPVPFSTLAGIGSLSLRLDGKPVPFLRWDQDTSGGCLLTWDTTYESPGDHCVQVELCLNGRTRPGALGPIRRLAVSVDEPPYAYPLRPGTADWIYSDPSDLVNSVVIPQSWLTAASSWQVFCSAVANPYFRSICLSGVSMSRSYDATKHGTVAILSTVEQSTDFGANCLRYLCLLDIPTLASIRCSDWNGACWLDYAVVCHMAGLKSSLTTLDQASLQRLFRIAVWDANYFISSGDTMVATAPVSLMYAIYYLPETTRGPFPTGLTLPDLVGDPSYQLDRGHLPPELGSSVSAAATALGLASRP